MLEAPPPYEVSTLNQHGKNGTAVTTSNSVTPITSQPTVQGASRPQRRADGLRIDMVVKKGNRLIIGFEKVSCYMFQETGLHPRVKQNIPLEIESKGISAET